MNKKTLIHTLVLVLVGLLLAACGSGSEPDLIATQVAVERAAAATLTAEAPQPVPTEAAPVLTDAPATQPVPTEVAPAPTVTLSPTEPLLPTPTQAAVDPTATPTPIQIVVAPPATPTPTPTPTPSLTPIQIVVPPPGTPAPRPSPIPCAVQAQGVFAGLWQDHKDRLGCPLYAQPKVIQDAEQAFDNGHMFWRADNDRAYVVYEAGSNSGTYQVFANMWSDGDPEYSCAASPPAGKVQPKRGFGAVWCSLGGTGAAIGWGLGDEAGFGPGYGDPLVQDFERGVIFRDSDGGSTGWVYLFFADGTFARKNY